MSDVDAIDVPGYRIVSRIMAGGMATVYIAEQLKLGSRRVAIKIFRNRNPDQALADHTKTRHKRFAQEALIARNLQHPHIVQIFDYGSTDEFQFLVMEYLAHGDLKRRIREGLLPLQILEILQQVANALSLLHRNDIVHRDIKPANILFREPGHAVLADFGIARSIEQDTQLTNTGFVLGTPGYMSPEQINGGRVTAKTDIYALGVVFYEMLTGHLPYRGDSVQSVATQHLMAPVPPLPLEVRKLQPLLNRLMAKKPEDRIANGSELLEALARIDSSRSFAVKPPTFMQIHARKIAAVAALMFGSVAITWAGISQLPSLLSVGSSAGAADVESLPFAAPDKSAREQVAVPIQTAQPMRVAAEPVLQKVDLNAVSPAANVLSQSATEKTPPQAVAPETKPVQRPQQQRAERAAKPGANKKRIAAPAQSMVVEVASPEPVQNITEPATAGKHEVAEPRAAYASAAALMSPEHETESQPQQAKPAPVESAKPDVPEKKRKLPPVISFF